MAEKKIAIRLSLEDSERVKEALKSLGVAGESAMKQIEAATNRPLTSIKSFENLRDRLDEGSRAATELAKSIKTIEHAYNTGRVTDPYTKAFLSGNEALKERDRLLQMVQERARTASLLPPAAPSLLERVNATTGVSGLSSSVERAADVEAYGASLNRLRERFVPLYAEQVKYKQALIDIREAQKLGALSEGEMASAIARTKAAFAGQVRSMGDVSASGKLTRMQMMTLQYTFNDVVASLASGISPMTILMQQGGQVTQAFGGLGATLRSLITPTTIMVGSILTLSAGIGVLSVAWEKNERTMKSFEVSLAATGRSSQLSRAQIESLIDASSQMANVDRASATSMVQMLTRMRQVSADSYEKMISLAGDYAAVTGEKVPDALKELATGLKRPAQFADQLHEKFGILTFEQYRQIEASEKAGRAQEGQAIIMQELEKRIGGLKDQALTPFQTSINDLGNAWESVKKSFSDQGWIADFVGGVASATKSIANMIRPYTPQEQLAKVEAQIKEEQEKIANGSFSASPSKLALFQKDRETLLAQKASMMGGAGTAVVSSGGGENYVKSSLEDTRSLSERSREIEKSLDASREAERRAREERERATKSIEDQIKALHDESEGLDLNEREREIHKEMIKAENTARGAGITLTESQIKALKEETGALCDKKNALEKAKKEQEKAKQEHEKTAREIEHISERTSDKIADAFVNAFDGSKTALESFRDFFYSTLKEIAANSIIRPVIQPVVATAVGQAKGLSFSGIFDAIAGIFHEGGIVGASAPTRSVPALAFAGAPRYHSGIYNLGLKSDERPAILQTGETVLPRGTKIGSNVTVNVINKSGAEVSTDRRMSGGVETIDVTIGKIVSKQVTQRSSSVSRSIRQTFGANERLVQR